VLYGLTEGSTTEPCSRFTQTTQSFNSPSKGSLAELSPQKEFRRWAALSAGLRPLPPASAYQARKAQIAPPRCH
jgi:hypothetical protein